MRGIALLLALGISGQLLAADCGCEKPVCNTCNAKVTIQVCERPTCCRTPRCLHHHCKSCCEQPAQQTPRGNAAPPAGPIYESMPMARSMPMMAMPVMMASYQVAPHAATYEEPRPRETTCASSASEIELLKQRFERLHERVNTLQTSMDRQTQILEKITENLEKLNGKKD